ncbi:hypothetical protein GOODEAATRI_019944, partial [Goodea atripinnis]
KLQIPLLRVAVAALRPQHFLLPPFQGIQGRGRLGPSLGFPYTSGFTFYSSADSRLIFDFIGFASAVYRFAHSASSSFFRLCHAGAPPASCPTQRSADCAASHSVSTFSIHSRQCPAGPISR